jgi:hypothetical protein
MHVKTKNKIMFITIFAIILFSCEFLFRSVFSEISVKLVKKVLKEGDMSHCNFLKSLQFFEYEGRFLLLFVVYNFTNTFSALSLVLLDSFSVYLNGVMKMIYQEPRPFWVETDLYPCICASNYGNPSTTGINQFILFAVTYKAFTSTYKNLNKFLIASLCGVPVILIYSSRLFQGIHSLNQLFFGLGIGFILYYIYFEIMSINLESKSSFNYFFKHFYKICFILISLFLLTTILHLYFIEIEPNKKWLKVILKYCETVNYNLFDNESYRKTSKVFLFVGCLIGVYLENQILFHKNHKLVLFYSSHNKYRFSNTTVDKSLFRVLIMMSGYLIILKLFFENIADPKTDSFFYITITAFIIPYLVYGILIFFSMKTLVRYLGLTNENILNGLNELDSTFSNEKLKHQTFYEELGSADTKITMELMHNLNEPLLK